MNLLPATEEGAASTDLAEKAGHWWTSVAALHNIGIEFDFGSSFRSRLDWARAADLQIGTIYSRFSTKLQHSTDDQVRECIQWAARNGIYVPPELISVDEGVKGKRLRRVGLDRTKHILSERLASVLLVFKASRLFRQAGKGYQFINEEVVEEGLRAVSVSQGIDTNDKKTWKLQLQIHGLLDDLLLDAIADHVRSGLTGLHLNNWTTGAIGVGYRRKEIANAPTTNRGLPRTMPEIDPIAAELIRKHALMLLDGMSLREGVRHWNESGGPCDPRSTTGKMTYAAYRRLMSNRRLIGVWEFGRRRNQFSTKLDYVKQIEQSDDEVTTVTCEELRILDDETFEALQSLLEQKRTGPQGPRKRRPLRLWDLTTEFFICTHCGDKSKPVRFHQAGASGRGMRCKNGDTCNRKSIISREHAVRGVCGKLVELIANDTELVAAVAKRSLELDMTADDGVNAELKAAEKRLKLLNCRIDDLFELSGEGTKEDRDETKARLRATQAERVELQAQVDRLRKSVDGVTATMSPADVSKYMSTSSTLLTDAATGELGDDGVYQTLAVFRAITGEKVHVRVEQRPSRKQTNVRGVFSPQVVHTSRNDRRFGDVELWLREPPLLDLIAPRVHELIDHQGLSHRETAKQLRREGHAVNSGNVWYSYRRWYEMQGIPCPSLPYNNGKRRKPV
ncbi:MAG: recombinase family protein [Planctomycetaceae bacterium]|nr:recombinase family protein [Planctomycetales bacterium]MCA9144138.1 recombinase family protein [Planctomycetales bacterium]MCB9941312.1 recombinase family protein [Planctomycetaceae bacterium]